MALVLIRAVAGVQRAAASGVGEQVAGLQPTRQPKGQPAPACASWGARAAVSKARSTRMHAVPPGDFRQRHAAMARLLQYVPWRPFTHSIPEGFSPYNSTIGTIQRRSLLNVSARLFDLIASLPELPCEELSGRHSLLGSALSVFAASWAANTR